MPLPKGPRTGQEVLTPGRCFQSPALDLQPQPWLKAETPTGRKSQGRGAGLLWLPQPSSLPPEPGLGQAEEALKAAGEGEPKAKLQLRLPGFDLPSAFRLLLTSAINLRLLCWPGPLAGCRGQLQPAVEQAARGPPSPALPGAASWGRSKNHTLLQAKAKLHQDLWSLTGHPAPSPSPGPAPCLCHSAEAVQGCEGGGGCMPSSVPSQPGLWLYGDRRLRSRSALSDSGSMNPAKPLTFHLKT